ncbi:MAG: SMP-30/gluconolactonase/LRE family protein [Planctomycetes bacterium]|nr:SMP-30/gluconolactonase/LRE family protein [Planctomycetota bacterium]
MSDTPPKHRFHRRYHLLVLPAAPLVLLGAVLSGCYSTTKRMYPVVGSIERADPRLDKLIPLDARIEKLAEGFEWSEGPAWVKDGGFLVFSDVPRNHVLRWKEGEGLSVFLKPSGYTGEAKRGGEPGSNGLAVDAEGRLVLCQHGDRRVARREKDGKTFTTLADRHDGKRLNSPNDLAYRSNGDLYFTDPPYGLEKGMGDPAKELDFQGVYRVTAKGELTLLTKEVQAPNGIALSPDEKTLYVANSDGRKAVWYAFEVKEDGTLGPSRTFFDSTAWVQAGKKGVPDGLKVDVDGNLFATGPGGVCIFAPDGTHLGTIATGEATANCAWGDDGSTLYITADMYLLRVKTTTKGKGF